MLWVRFFIFAFFLFSVCASPRLGMAQDDVQEQMQDNDAVAAQEKELEDKYKVYYVTAKQIKNYIDRSKGQKRAIYLFSASCEECIRRMPDLMDIEVEREGAIVPINIDTDYKVLKRYLMYYQHLPFDIIVNKGMPYDLVSQMKPYGVRAWTTLPRVWLLDEDNNLVGQGGHSPDKIRIFLGMGKENTDKKKAVK